jgi:addiction module RelE/StbE family toxin
MKLVWTPEAIADRRAIYIYIEAENPLAALELDEHFTQRAAQLRAHPMIGRPGRVLGTRELVVRNNYMLIYDIDAETIRMLRVLHTAQQWPPNPAVSDRA